MLIALFNIIARAETEIDRQRAVGAILIREILL